MEKIYSILTIAIVIIASVFTSCESKSGKRLQERLAKQTKDSLKKVAAQKTADSFAELPVTFIPEKIITTGEYENRNDKCGDMGEKCHTYIATIVFINPKGENYSLTLENSFLESQKTQQLVGEMASSKKVFSEIVNTPTEKLEVTYYPKWKSFVVVKIIEQTKIGYAYLMNRQVIYDSRS